jgi:hypothetical protein
MSSFSVHRSLPPTQKYISDGCICSRYCKEANLKKSYTYEFREHGIYVFL